METILHQALTKGSGQWITLPDDVLVRHYQALNYALRDLVTRDEALLVMAGLLSLITDAQMVVTNGMAPDGPSKADTINHLIDLLLGERARGIVDGALEHDPVPEQKRLEAAPGNAVASAAMMPCGAMVSNVYEAYDAGLERGAQAADNHAVAEQIARIISTDPKVHSMEIVRVISTAIRKLKVQKLLAPETASAA